VLAKILKGAGVAIVGALLTYITDQLVKVPPAYLPFVTAGWSVIANIIRKWIGVAVAKA
jgi:hypothetical protein